MLLLAFTWKKLVCFLFLIVFSIMPGIPATPQRQIPFPNGKSVQEKFPSRKMSPRQFNSHWKFPRPRKFFTGGSSCNIFLSTISVEKTSISYCFLTPPLRGKFFLQILLSRKFFFSAKKSPMEKYIHRKLLQWEFFTWKIPPTVRYFRQFQSSEISPR